MGCKPRARRVVLSAAHSIPAVNEPASPSAWPSRAIQLRGEAELLDDPRERAAQETSPGVLRMDHDADKHDERAMALPLEAHHLVNRPAGMSWRPL